MFKILVADDESVIRKGIIAILKRTLDTDICYLEAGDGIEALELYKEHLPQIIITDIRMPRLNGLELIENMSKFGFLPTIIILSGYADFEYARSAISLGVKEYVLKPIKKQEFINLIDSYIKKIIIEEEHVQLKSIQDDASKSLAKVMLQELAISFLNCNNADKSKYYLEKLSKLNINFRNQLLMCGMIQYRTCEERDGNIAITIIKFLAEQMKHENRLNCVFIIQYDSCRLAAVFEGRERELMLTAVRQVLGEVCSSIRQNNNSDVFAGIGNIIYGPEFFYKSFQSACKVLNFKLFSHVTNIQIYSEICLGEVCQATRFDDLIQSLEDINSTEIIRRFESLLRLSPSLNIVSAIEQSYANLIDTIAHKITKYNMIKAENLHAPISFFELWSFSHLKYEVIKYVEQVQEYACKASIDVSNKKLIVDVLSYVKENAIRDINLNIVAEHFSRTPAYMSTLFKKGTGEGFNTFLNRIRIDLAKEMLADSNIPIHEVSGLCGYSNSKYFSVVFKKMVGVSPATYRQNFEN
jgi:two-component system, response regulator YesN